MILSIVTNVMIVNHLPVVEFDFADLYEGEFVASSIKTLLDDRSDSLILKLLSSTFVHLVRAIFLFFKWNKWIYCQFVV